MDPITLTRMLGRNGRLPSVYELRLAHCLLDSILVIKRNGPSGTEMTYSDAVLVRTRPAVAHVDPSCSCVQEDYSLEDNRGNGSELLPSSATRQEGWHKY